MRTAPEKDPARVAVLEKIADLEREGRFDLDVEADPPTIPLKPGDVDYLDRSLGKHLRTWTAFAAARIYFCQLVLRRRLILKPAEGLEHLRDVPGGAVITCNHFHPMDSFLMQLVFEASHHRGKLYRIIREGNYTSFPGFYGFLMRNCNTLPLSANLDVMKKFLNATEQILAEGNCVLMYPEQSLWWNYRKPKPMKTGAFELAVRCGVPVVPCFITMADNHRTGPDGFPVQEYTPHLGQAIYPDPALSRPAAREKLRQQTQRYCLDTYQQVYGAPPVYLENV